MPSSAHFIYIPLVALMGMLIGFILGGRAARNAFDMERKREAERAAARAQREARKQAKEAAGGAGGAGGSGQGGTTA